MQKPLVHVQVYSGIAAQSLGDVWDNQVADTHPLLQVARQSLVLLHARASGGMSPHAEPARGFPW